MLRAALCLRTEEGKADKICRALTLVFSAGMIFAFVLLCVRGTPNFTLLVFALSLAVLEQGFLLIHSSTVVCAGKAVLFLGESGTGKSTHSRLWLENLPDTSLLNDDGPALRVQADGSVTVYGTPWSGKTPCYRDVSYPLGAFVRICRAPYNRLSPRLSAIQALGATLPSCLPTLQQEDTLLDRVCANLSAVLRVAPVFRMECLPDADAARLSFETTLARQ